MLNAKDVVGGGIMNPTKRVGTPYDSKVLEVLNTFKAMGPWRGTVGERIDKFTWLHRELCKIFGKRVHLAFDIPADIKDWYSSGGSFHIIGVDGKEWIVLQGKLSVITFLHEWGHALGMDQWEAQEWATSIFKQVFPEQWKKLKNVGGMMVVE